MSPSSEQFVVGIDIGSSSLKGLLLSAQAQPGPAVSVTMPWETTGDNVEMPAASLISALKQTLAMLHPPGEIAAIGFAGMAESGAAFDLKLRPLSPVIAWNDPRGHQVAEDLRENFPGIDRRIGQKLRYICSAAKAGDLFRKTGSPAPIWLGVPELCLWALTGQRATEHSLVCRTGWYHLAERQYMPDVAAAAGVMPENLPTVMTAGEPMGAVTAGAASRLGLPAGIPVTIAGHDHLIAAQALALGPGDLGNSVGTAESVVSLQPQLPGPDATIEKGVATSLAPGGNGYGLLAGAGRAGIVLSRLARRLGACLEDLDAMAAGLEARADPGEALSFVRAIQEGAPYAVPADPGQAWMLALQGLSLRTVDAAMRLGTEYHRVVVFGGGAAPAAWLSLKAAEFKVPVFTARAVSPAAAGAAMYAGIAAGWWASGKKPPPVQLIAVSSSAAPGN